MGFHIIKYTDAEALAAAVAGAVSTATASKLVVRDGSARAKFAAPGAAGDALIKGTRVTTAELPAMTDEKIWKGSGASVEEIGIGTGADDVAAGNHTHTLGEDVVGSTPDTTDLNTSGTFYRVTQAIPKGEDLTICSVTRTFAAISMAVAVGVLHRGASVANRVKARLYMGGVQVAESSYFSPLTESTVLIATRALSGSQICALSAHNYDDYSRNVYGYGQDTSSDAGGGIGVGSIKI